MNNAEKEYVFSIADIPFVLHTSHKIKVTDAFQPFRMNEKADGIKVNISVTDGIDIPIEEPVFKNISFAVYEQAGRMIRIYHDHKEGDTPYALEEILSDKEDKVEYINGAEKFFCESKNSFAHIALEELLLRQGAMILHSSFISTRYGGILFSGPSGIGKSTQADLWVKHRNAKLINGDRTIIRKKEDEWKAYGSPYAGSSKCFVNKSENIKMIVMLEQNAKCEIRKLSILDAFVKCYSGMIVNTWNSEYVMKISELTQKLVQEIPVYLLSATANIDSVELLERVLEKESPYES